jgi:diguanylate cyclase (GGDEF)-like protein/PAS domain S-box-containing protein
MSQGCLVGVLSTKQLELVVDLSPSATFTVDGDGQVSSWNRAAQTLFGWSAEEVLGKPLALVSSESLPTYLTLRGQLVPDRVFEDVRLRCATKSGARVNLSFTLASLCDPSGTLVGLIAAVKGRAEERAETAVAERQREELHQLQVILDAIPAPIFYKDANTIYRGCNKAFEAYLGKSRSEIVGKSVYDIAPKDLADIYHEADLALFQQRGAQIYESSVLYADQTRHDVIFNKAPFLDAKGDLGGLVGTILDITARKQVERALRESEARYRGVVAALQEGILLVSRERQVLATNSAAESILGLSKEEIQQLIRDEPPRWGESEDGTPFPFSANPLMRTLASGQSESSAVIGLNRRDGSRVWLSMSARPLFRSDDPTALFAVVASFADISERKRAEERLEYQAFHDPLTGLPNRALFINRLEHALAYAHRRSEPLAVACLDLDRFKIVNDTLGHDAGDRLLRDVARRLARGARGSDTVARMGGDEFMVILPGVLDAAQAEAAARRMLAALRPALEIEGHELRLSASIGITLYPFDGEDVGTLLRNADRAMYRAKESGKNDFRLFAPEADGVDPSRLQFESQLHRAIERDELRVEYQPVIDLRDGCTVAFEALLRWQSRERGLVMPDQIIPIAEETGMILAIGEWVLFEACRRMAELSIHGKRGIRMAVNVSQVQFGREDFVGMVTRTLRATRLPARLLELELTESVVMRDTDLAVERISELRSMGVAIAIDDFGTGYSSLSYLRRLPTDTLKIDRSFIQDLEGAGTRESAPIVQPIIALAHSLGMRVVAEGVETDTQLGILRKLGCDCAQGFGIARPTASLRTIHHADAPRGLPQLVKPNAS